MTREILLFIGGVGVLYFGAEWLVRGSARLASSMGVKPIVLGLTVVSMGTSAPELVISVVASWGGNPDLAIGNVMGSNLANIGLVLGISAITRPLVVSGRVVTREVPVMLIITAALLPIIWNLHIGRLEGLALIAMVIAYLAFILWTAKEEGTVVLGEYEEFAREAVGLSAWTSVRDIRLITMGISELVIGLTLVSIGTSLPELATCVVAAWRREADIAVGNILGSNVFNLTAILGITSTITPMDISPQVLQLDFPAVMIISVLLVPIVRADSPIRRREGFLLLGAYVTLGFWVLS